MTVGVRLGLTDGQKANQLIAKRAKIYANVKKIFATLRLEVNEESLRPVDNLAVTNSLQDKLARIKDLVSQLWSLTYEIQITDAAFYDVAEHSSHPGGRDCQQSTQP